MNTTLKIFALFLLTSVTFLACQKDPTLPSIPPLDENEYPITKLDSILEFYPRCSMWDISTPPDAVNSAFHQQFSNVKDVEWEEGCDLYEVSFEIKNIDYEAVYDFSGALLFYKQDVENRSIPEAVKSTIDTRYNDYLIDDVDKVFMTDGIYYDVDLDNKNDRDLKICVKEDGTLVYERFD